MVKVALLLVGSLLAACSVAQEPQSGSSRSSDSAAMGAANATNSAPRSVLRLVEQLGSATTHFEVPSAGLFSGTLGEAAPEDLAFADEMSGAATGVTDGAAIASGWPGPWRDHVFVARALETGVVESTIEPRSQRATTLDGRSSVRVPAQDFLLALLAADEAETWLVRAWVKPLAPQPEGGVAPSLSYLPLKKAAPTDAEFAATVHDLSQQIQAIRPRETALAAGAEEWTELRAVARPYPGRRSLALFVSGGDRGVALDRVELRRLTTGEALALSIDESVEPATHPLRRHVELDMVTCDCIALPTPGRVVFDVALPEEKPRLEMQVAALADRAGGTVNVRVEIAGQCVDSRTVELPAADALTTARRARYLAYALDLTPFAGKRVQLAFTATGPRGSVALLGAPVVLGTAASVPPNRSPRLPSNPIQRPSPNLVVVSLDTLRADHLGCYGAKQIATPRIDALAAAGTRFARVLSPASYTLPTHLSMLSGQDPLVHQTVMATQPMDPARTLMIAARLRAEGYRTAAFTAGGLVHPRYGFGVGFDSYSIRDPGGVVGLHRRIGDPLDHDAAPGEDRMAAVVDWLGKSRDVPFFLFLHTYLVHNYRPHQAWLDRIGGGARPSPDELTTLRGQASSGDRAATARLSLLYRASIEEADHEIVGRLLDALDALQLADRTLVVLVADHGEEFFEHAMIGHGDELWHTLTHVPWIVRGPGVPRGAVREEPVALTDVAATIAGQLALGPDPRVLSRDRLLFADATQSAVTDSNATHPDAINPTDDDEPQLLSLRHIADHPDQDALVRWPWKLVRRRIGDAPWPVKLFQLDDDPGEAHDRSADEPQRTAGMTRQLDARLKALAAQASALSTSTEPRAFEMSPEMEQMLDALGYTPPASD